MNTDELKLEIFRNKLTQQEVAKLINVTPKTFYNKMKKGVFGTDEVEILIDVLNIDKNRAVEIFFD